MIQIEANESIVIFIFKSINDHTGNVIPVGHRLLSGTYQVHYFTVSCTLYVRTGTSTRTVHAYNSRARSKKDP